MNQDMNLNTELNEQDLENINGGCGFLRGYWDYALGRKKKNTWNPFYNWGWDKADRDRQNTLRVLNG